MALYKRRILIGGRDYSRVINACSFTWVKDGGCDSASLTIDRAPFDSFMDIEIGDKVEIRYGTSASTRWWYGFVNEMDTDINNGLNILCVGARLKLGEIYPLGRFGTKVEVTTPTGLTYLVTEVGGELSAALYTYRVSAIDTEGETLCSSTVGATVTGSTGIVDLSWTAVEGATGYRVYRGTANPYTYWQTSETTFQDDGTSAGTTIAALPVASTASAPDVASAYVDDVLDYLLTTYLPDDLGTGDITAGDAFELDDYDLGDGSAPLLDVISALADIVGDVVWGCDENGDVYFVPEATTFAYVIDEDGNVIAEPESTSYSIRFRLGKQTKDNNLLTSVSRRRSRAGVTAVRILGEDALNDSVRETELDSSAKPADDWPSPRVSVGRGYARSLNHRFGSKISATTAPLTESITQLTADYASVSTQVALVPELAALRRVALQWNGSAHVVRPPYTEAIIERQLAQINRRIAYVKNMRATGRADFENMERRKPVPRYLPGVKTPGLARIAAANFAAQYVAVPDRWNATIEGLTNLIKPGIDVVRITTQFGDSYNLPVQSASYNFEDVVTCSLELGNPEYDESKETEDTKKMVQRLISKAYESNVYVPYTP